MPGLGWEGQVELTILMSDVERIGKVSKFENTRESFPEKLDKAFGKATGYHCRIIRGALPAGRFVV